MTPDIRPLIVLLAFLSMIILAGDRVANMHTSPTLPNPILFFMGQEGFETGGKSYMRYKFAVDNYKVYPDELFAAAPSLPPCGSNTKASRTWVDVYDQSGRRLNGFCALGTSEDLNKIWFALEADVVPPSWVYIEMTDRQTGTKYKSNLSETTD